MRTNLLVLSPLLLLASLPPVRAAVIDNGIVAGTPGHFSVDVLDGGETLAATITGTGTPSGTVFTTDVIFEYTSFVDVGNNGGGFRLGTFVDPGGTDPIMSAGSFVGTGGNTINWSVSSTLPANSSKMTSTFTFTAQIGSLGVGRFYQYLDEDVLGFSNDVFFTTGSAGSNDLQLFTLDNTEAIGISHGGAYSSAAGLVNATFAGWAANTYNSINPSITGAGQAVAVGGVNALSMTLNHPVISPLIGGNTSTPVDVVSVLAWDFDPNASRATIITTLGGVPDVTDLPPNRVIPEPAALAIWGILALSGLVLSLGRTKRARTPD